MGIKEKLDLLSLSEKERKIAEEKFLTSLSLVTYDELKEVVDYLASKNVFITKARQLKVVTILKNDIARNFDILGEIHETQIYEQDPSKISSNVIDINKKIKYCIQNGIPYKKEDGTYEQFLFSEKSWKEMMVKETKVDTKEVTPVLDETLVSIKPVVEESNIIEFNPVLDETPEDKQAEIIPFSPVLEEDSNVMDIKEFQNKNEVPTMTFDNLTNSVQKMQNELGNIETQKNALEQEKAELKAFQDSIAKEFVSFDDLDFEQFRDDSFGMGRAA